MHRRVDLRISGGTGDEAPMLAATVHLPPPDRVAERSPVIVAMPGGGYNRRYFDLRTPGYSEAAHHVAAGRIVIALDHLGVGESDVPPGPLPSLTATAAANHAAVQAILARLAAGTLAEGIAPIAPAPVIGEGQSMGGHLAAIMQANHRTFAGLAILGSSFVCTRLRAADPANDICLLGQDDYGAILSRLPAFDWRYAFHWEDVPAEFTDAEDADRDGSGSLPYWRSATVVDAAELMLPAGVARAAAAVTVPVLLGMGERDVCQDPLRELAAFLSTRDLSLFVCPHMAHMHNFAGTRIALWRRVGSFVDQLMAR